MTIRTLTARRDGHFYFLRGCNIKKNIISEELENRLNKLIAEHRLNLSDIFDIGGLGKMEITYIHDNKNSPRDLVKISLHKSQYYFMQQGEKLVEIKE